MSKYRNQYRQGNIGDERTVTVGGFSNLDAVTTVTATVTRTGETTGTLTGAVTDSAASEITVQLGVWLETAAVGKWYVKYTLTFADGDVIQVPDDPASDIIEVTAP